METVKKSGSGCEGRNLAIINTASGKEYFCILKSTCDPNTTWVSRRCYPEECPIQWLFFRDIAIKYSSARYMLERLYGVKNVDTLFELNQRGEEITLLGD